MFIQVLAAFAATVLFCVIFNISRYQLFFCGLNGALSWFIYLSTLSFTNSVITSSLIATLIVCILAHILAKVRKTPVIIFQIGGIIPLVPGAGMYHTLYSVVEENYTKATYELFQTIEIAGSIAVGMILISSLNKMIFEYKNSDNNVGRIKKDRFS